MREDKNKGISIRYNYLNNPDSIWKTNLDYVAYQYDAGGMKLRRITKTGTVRDTVHYVSGVQYAGRAIDFVPHPEGIVKRTTGGWEYQYHIVDHLGNLRVAFTKATGTHTATLLQSNHYYAFGNNISGWETTGAGAPHGIPIKDIDFTDHGRPELHPNPHQHEMTPTGGTPRRGDPEPLNSKPPQIKQ